MNIKVRLYQTSSGGEGNIYPGAPSLKILAFRSTITLLSTNYQFLKLCCPSSESEFYCFSFSDYSRVLTPLQWAGLCYIISPSLSLIAGAVGGRGAGGDFQSPPGAEDREDVQETRLGRAPSTGEGVCE